MTDLHIDAEFPGGNIALDAIGGDTVRLHQALRDTERDWFYWYFRIRGARGRHLRFELTRSQALGARGPAISLDAGQSWSWLGADAVDGNTFAHSFAAHGPDDIRFSFAMPYQLARWQAFIDDLQGSPALSVHSLCTTSQQRDIDYVLVGCNDDAPKHRVAITCRHHCCEMMMSYALEGLVDWVVRAQAKEAQWLRSSTQFFIVPFVDLDGVEAGDQGKGRQPRDHGRDYEGDSIYAATGAVRRLLPIFGDGLLRACLDLHCPWISGPRNEVIFLVGSADSVMAEEQQRFTAMLADTATGPLPVSPDDFLAFGTSWNTNDNHTDGIGFARWATALPQVRLATGIELPYATAGGVQVDQVTARRFGADLGAALATWLQQLPT